MNAAVSELLRATQALNADVTRPIAGSRKIYVEGRRAAPGSSPGQPLRVPMREISLADTPSMFGVETNAPFTVYDTSGPYTDPEYSVDLAAGLPALRACWIAERNDTDQLADFTSPFTRRHANARELADVRFPNLPKPRCAKSGANVTQMHSRVEGSSRRKWSSSPSARTSGWMRCVTPAC